MEIQQKRNFQIKQSNSAVEIWMGMMLNELTKTITKVIKEGHTSYNKPETIRKEWVMSNKGQVVAVVCQLDWTNQCEFAIQSMDENPYALQDLLDINKTQLEQLTDLIRSNLPSLRRKILIALITTDVHGRDIVAKLTSEGVCSTSDFLWQ